MRVGKHGDTLAIVWVYDLALFDTWRIEQMADHCCYLLDACAPSRDQIVQPHHFPPQEESEP